MEDRLPAVLHLEMTDLPAGEYRDRRAHHFGASPVALFANLCRDRDDLPRELAEFDLLAVVEMGLDAPVPPADSDLIAVHRFRRTSRPGQGSISAAATDGLQLVLISPKEPDRAQELRDWGDFVHLRHIAEASVPGFGMITPYINLRAEQNPAVHPLFMHFYEMHTRDPEAAFQAMTPLVAERLGGRDGEAFREWAWHPQLSIDYVNTFTRVG